MNTPVDKNNRAGQPGSDTETSDGMAGGAEADSPMPEDSSPDAIVIHGEGKCLYANAAAARLLAAANPNELIGRDLFTATDSGREGAGEFGRAAGEGGQTAWAETKFARLDGEVIDVEMVSLPVTYRGGVAVKSLLRDVTARKRAEDALQKSEERCRALLEQSTEGVWCFDFEQPLDTRLTPDEQIEHFFRFAYLAECNDVMARMYGFSRADDILGARGDALLDPDQPQNLEYLRAFVRSGYRLTDAESVERDSQGGLKHILNNLIGIIHDGAVMRVWGTQRDVTERKRIEQALQEGEERYRELVENANDLIYTVDLGGNFTSANKAAEAMLGYPRTELLRMNMAQVLTPEQLEIARGMLRKKLETRGTSAYEIEVLTRGGQRKTLEVSTRLILHGGKPVAVQGTARDVTKRNAIEQALKESERKYRNLFENANDAILIVEPATSVILEVNNRACEMYGYPKEELQGLTLRSLTKDEGLASAHICESLQRGGLKSFEAVHLRKDGAPLEILAGASAIEYGGLNALMVIVRDITEIKRLQEQLIQSEKLAGLGQLISGVAHELNNPLTSVLGYVQLIRAGGHSDEETAEYLGIVEQEAERTRRIVKNLLAFSRQHQPSQAKVDLNGLIRRILELRARDLKAARIEVIADLKPLPIVMADEHQIQQVLINLITNAEQALRDLDTPRVLKVRTEKVDQDGQCWGRVVVEDNGPGIPAEHLTKVFDPFFTTKPIGQGTGLGLSISYGIIKEHGGVIRAENHSGGGAAFTIDLPI